MSLWCNIALFSIYIFCTATLSGQFCDHWLMLSQMVHLVCIQNQSNGFLPIFVVLPVKWSFCIWQSGLEELVIRVSNFLVMANVLICFWFWFCYKWREHYDVHLDIVLLDYLIRSGLFRDDMIKNLDFVLSLANSFRHVK